MDELYQYQKDGAAWLAGKKVALLADDMGLGKSAQAIRAADIIGARRVLVLCPAIARINWLREFEKFGSLRREFRILAGKKARPDPGISAVCSYDLAAGCIGENEFFDVLILDEAHYLKSLDAKRAKAVLGKTGLVHRANRIWALTGTPMPNHPGELWPLLFTFCRTPLSYYPFIEKYCSFLNDSKPSGGMFQITGANKALIPELKELLAPIILRRKKEEVLKQLPPITFAHCYVEPSDVEIEAQSSLIQYILPVDRRQELYDQLEKEKVVVDTVLGHVGVLGESGMKALEALAQSVSTLRKYLGLQKVKVVADMVTEELTNKAYDKVVIFAVHRDVIEGLRQRLRKFGAVTCYGNTDPKSRQQHVDSFQNNPKCKVFIGNIQAAGTAITLTAANQIVFIEQDWVPGNNAQAAMRCHRIGQERPVFVRVCCVEDSLDEKIASILKRKTLDIIEIFDKG